VLLGDGTGAFGPPVNILAERSASRIIAADLNGDARPDIIAASDVFNNLTVVLNTCGSPPATTFTISGAVKDGSNKGIAEVAMILVSDVAEPQIALTDARMAQTDHREAADGGIEQRRDPRHRESTRHRGKHRDRKSTALTFPCLLDSSKQVKNQDDHHDKTDTATRPIPPASAVRPTRDRADQEKNQDY
jgi:hypothetical protein